jgi:Peptidase family M28
MLDNASGSAAILDIAQKLRNVTPLNKLRFIWFGGEELGLLGSTYYVNNLTPSDYSHIGYDLDADVFGTPNYIIGILDPAAPDFFGRTVSTTFPANVYEPSKVSEQQSIDFFNSAGFNHELSRRSEPTPSASTPPESRRAACLPDRTAARHKRNEATSDRRTNRRTPRDPIGRSWWHRTHTCPVPPSNPPSGHARRATRRFLLQPGAERPDERKRKHTEDEQADDRDRPVRVPPEDRHLLEVVGCRLVRGHAGRIERHLEVIFKIVGRRNRRCCWTSNLGFRPPARPVTTEAYALGNSP